MLFAHLLQDYGDVIHCVKDQFHPVIMRFWHDAARWSSVCGAAFKSSHRKSMIVGNCAITQASVCHCVILWLFYTDVFFTYIDQKGLEKTVSIFPSTFSWRNSRWPPPVTNSLIIAISLALNGIETWTRNRFICFEVCGIQCNYYFYEKKSKINLCQP